MSFLSIVVIQMTLSLHSSSPYSVTQTIDTPRYRMFSNVALNAFCQSIIDQSSVVDEIGVPSIDEHDIDEKHKIKGRRRKRA